MRHELDKNRRQQNVIGILILLSIFAWIIGGILLYQSVMNG